MKFVRKRATVDFFSAFLQPVFDVRHLSDNQGVKMRLGSYEIDILRALASGEDLTLSSTHRVRLELLGLTKETPSGVVLTQLGERSQHLRPSITHKTEEPPERRLDALGRRHKSDRTAAGIG